MTAGRFLTYDEAADRLRVSRRFLEQRVAAGQIAYHRMGRKVLFTVEDLDAFAGAGRVEAFASDPSQVFAERRNRARGLRAVR